MKKYALLSSRVIAGALLPLAAHGQSLLVSDLLNNQVRKYDGVTGAFIQTFAFGNGLNDPAGMTFGRDGNLYVCSYSFGNSEIFRFNGRTGSFIDVFYQGGQFAYLGGIALGPDGNFYVGIYGSIRKLDGSTGADLGASSYYGLEGSGVAVDAQNNVFAVGNGFIVRFNPDLSFYSSFAYPGNRDDVAIGPDGNVYATSPSAIYKFDPDLIDGSVFSEAGSFNFDGLTFGNGGDIYAVDPTSDQVRRFDGQTGAYEGVFVGDDGRDFQRIISLGVVLPPTAFTVERGMLQSGALAQLISSDDGRMIIQARPPISLTEPNIRLRVDGTAPTETATQLKFRVEGHSTGIPISAVLEVIHMFNFDTGQYEEVSRRPSTPSDRVTEVTIAVDAARFIQNGTRLMRSRVSYFDTGVFSPAWVARIDETTWQHTP